MEKLDKAINLRTQGRPEEALLLINELLREAPSNPSLNYQAAWTCDSMGKESEAAPFYEAALANGLSGEERRGAFLGLGSTYRCLGLYQKSLDIFESALKEYPQDRAFKTFRALTFYNLGQFKKSVEELLIQLLDTTSDADIKKYERALRYYSDKLDQTWE